MTGGGGGAQHMEAVPGLVRGNETQPSPGDTGLTVGRGRSK